MATRSDAQIRSHAQKFFNKLDKKVSVEQNGQELKEVLRTNLRSMKK